MPIITGPAGMDPVLGEMRTINISGGTGGGGDNYTFNTTEFSVGIAGLVSLNQVPGNKVSGTASVEDVQTGGTQRLVDVSALRGALTAGQAVDVTSQPDGVTGDYKGTFAVTGSLGFARFPKHASGLNYLMIADLTATTSGTVTPSGTWLDGTTTAKSLAAGTSIRVAMLFNAAKNAKFTFASTGSVSVTNCREYEITACSNEAVNYIAALSNPDAFASYYLVKADMVQPWTYIIDMGTSPAVTIASGLSYKLNASTGTHQLTVDTCPAGYDGRDAIIRIRLGGSGVIQAVAPLQLGGALVPYAINNCVVRFRDGEAVLLVEDTLAGYIVTVNAGTGEGSLPYALAANGVPYIAFSPSTDGIPLDLSGATTAAEEVTVVGNGYMDTILTGGVSCTSKTTFANLSMQGVTVTGGTMTLGDVYIPSGGTVSVSGGSLAIENVSGGGTIDLGRTGIRVSSSGSGLKATVSGCAIVGGRAANGGAIYAYGSTFLSGCVFSGNIASNYAGAIYLRNKQTMIDCIVTDNTATTGGGVYVAGSAYLSGCTISGNTATVGPDVSIGNNSYLYAQGGCSFGKVILRPESTGNATFVFDGGTNRIDMISSRSYPGTVIISSGAVVDLTGNTNAAPINPGGEVIVASGDSTASCTVLTGATAGVVGAAVTIIGGTYTSIANDGTTVPPQPA